MTDQAGEPEPRPASVTGSSLLEWATGLAGDPRLRARLAEEPRTVLDEQGLATIPPGDLHHALPLVTESVAARLGVEVDASVLAAAAVQRSGEDAVDALARQLGAVTDTVDLGCGTTDDPAVDATGPDAPDPPESVDLDDGFEDRSGDGFDDGLDEGFDDGGLPVDLDEIGEPPGWNAAHALDDVGSWPAPTGPTAWADLDPEPAPPATASPPVTTEAPDATAPEPFEPERTPETGTAERYDDARHRADDADTEF